MIEPWACKIYATAGEIIFCNIPEKVSDRLFDCLEYSELERIEKVIRSEQPFTQVFQTASQLYFTVCRFQLDGNVVYGARRLINEDKMKKCARCHEEWKYKPKTQLLITCGECGAIIPNRGSCHYCGCTNHLKSERRAICPHCGYVEGEALVPSAWACEECAHTILDHGGDIRPTCSECGSQMSCLVAKPSGVCGAGTGDLQLEMGLELLVEAQEADLNLGTDLLREAQE